MGSRPMLISNSVGITNFKVGFSETKFKRFLTRIAVAADARLIARKYGYKQAKKASSRAVESTELCFSSKSKSVLRINISAGIRQIKMNWDM